MRILFVTPARENVGGFYRCLFLAKYLRYRGYDVAIVCKASRNTMRIKSKLIQGVPVILLPCSLNMFGASIIELINGLWIALRDLIDRYDIIHFFGTASPSSSIPALITSFRRTFDKPKIVVDFEDWMGRGGLLREAGRLPNLIGTYSEQITVPIADSITVVSDFLFKWVLGISPRSSMVFKIPNGANIDLIKPLPKLYAREKLGLPTDKIMLCHLGFADFTKIIGRIASKYQNILAVVVARLSPFSRFVVRTNERVLYAGSQPYEKVPLFLGAADILVLDEYPIYKKEYVLADLARWPIRLGDYLASGRPIVTNSIGETASVIREGRCGLLARPNDAEDMSKKILELIEAPSLREEFGRNARLLAENKYNWNLISKQLANIYHLLITEEH